MTISDRVRRRWGVALVGMTAFALVAACGSTVAGSAALEGDSGVAGTSDAAGDDGADDGADDAADDVADVADDVADDDADDVADHVADDGADDDADDADDADDVADDGEPVPDPAASAECLVGEWIVTGDVIQSFYDSVAPDQPVKFTVEGDAGLNFTDETYEWVPDFTLIMDINGVEATGTIAGTITGLYQTDDGIITTSMDESDIDMTITVMDQTMDGTAMGESFLNQAPIVDTPFSCADGQPVLMFETSDGGRVPMTLERA